MLVLINPPASLPSSLLRLPPNAEMVLFKIKSCSVFSATCIGPLGMESGVIGDNQIQASSSFEHASVGPHNAR